MESVATGKAYFLKSNMDQPLIYPDLGMNVPAAVLPNVPNNLTPWNDVVPTPVSQIIAFPIGVIESLQKGDFIGTFTSKGVCAGWVEVNDQAFALTANGEDPFNKNGNGFTEDEYISYKLYRPATNDEFDLEVEYLNGTNDPGLFTADGLSIISSLKVSSTGIKNLMPFSIRLYPNPAHDFVNIDGPAGDATIILTSSGGEEITTSERHLPSKLNLSNLSAGIYFVKIKTSNQSVIKKLVIN